MASMFDTIADMLRGSAPDDLAHALGTDRTQTRRAMEIGLPALITGLRDKTLEPGGAQALSSLLGDSSSHLPPDMDAYLSGGDPSQGAALLDVAFGDRGEPALAALSQASGLSTRLLAQVMSVLAPLATGVLATASDQAPDSLRTYLAGAVSDLEAKGFGRVVELVSPSLPADVAVVAAVPLLGDLDDVGQSPDEMLSGDEILFELDDDDIVVEIDEPIDVPDNDADDENEDADSVGIVVQGAFPDVPDAEDFVAVNDGPAFDDGSLIDEIVEIPAVPPIEFGDTQLMTEAPPAPAAVVIDETDFDKGSSLSKIGWLWWLIAAVLGVLLLLFLVNQCGGDDDPTPGADVDASGDTTPVPDSTPDPVIVQLQAQLDSAVGAYPGVTGTVAGPAGQAVAVLTGTVASDLENATLDAAVRAIPGLGVQNNITVVADAVTPGYNLNEIIAAQPELSQLAGLLDEAGLSAALGGTGPFTLLAPTNDALAAAQSQIDGLESREDLMALLQYHVLSGTLTGADIAASTTLPTLLSGDMVSVSTQGDQIILNQLVPILVSDVSGNNGVIHIIGGVLLPPSLTAATPEELSEALNLQPITFGLGSADLTTDGQAQLDILVTFLLENPTNLEIGGHTDSDGDAAFNQSLSQDRADSVKDYLASQGVPLDSMTAVGFGEDNPIAPNDTPENKAQNRRIEFRPFE